MSPDFLSLMFFSAPGTLTLTHGLGAWTGTPAVRPLPPKLREGGPGPRFAIYASAALRAPNVAVASASIVPTPERPRTSEEAARRVPGVAARRPVRPRITSAKRGTRG